MSDIDVLRELTDRLRPPLYDELVGVARKRRQRTAVTVAACTAVVVLGSGIAGAALWDSSGVVSPAQDPSPSLSESPTTKWTPERIRTEGTAVLAAGLVGTDTGSTSGPQAQAYCVGNDCSYFGDAKHWALELWQGEQLALFELDGYPWMRTLDEDSILVQDGTDQAPRFRLLQADGTALELRLISDLATAIPGPDVMLIQDLKTHRLGMIGPDGTREHPYLVDDTAGTLQLLDVPPEIEWWGPNVDEFLWGGDDCRVIWQQPDGSFDHHNGDCRDRKNAHTDPGWNWEEGFADWLEPGRLAMVEWSDNGHPLVVHASLDRGVTWQRIEIEDRNWGDTAEQIAYALADAMRQLS